MSTAAASPQEKSPEKSRDAQGVAADPALRGRGPAPGAANAGRPPVAFAEACKGLQRGVVLERVQQVLEDPAKGPKDADWQWCVRWISKYGEKETARRIEATLDVGPNLLEQMLRDREDA